MSIRNIGARHSYASKRNEILVEIDEAEQSLAHGERIPINERSIRKLAEDVKRRGRARARIAASK